MSVTYANAPIAPASTSVARLEGIYQAADGCPLHSYQWSSRAAEQRSGPVVVLMHGYGEHCERYREFASYLVDQGHPVYGFDARGHGRSPGRRGDIESFDKFVDDLHGFVCETKQRYRHRPLVLLGHSHGGLTALRVVQSRRPLPDALILVSPMIALRPSHRVPPLLAALSASIAGKLPLPNGLKATELSHDPAVVEASRRDPWCHSRTTPRWYAAATRAMQQAISQLDTVSLPILIFEAEFDPIVDPKAIERMARAIPSADKELVLCHGAFHEVLNEIGREQTYDRIGAWLASRFDDAAAA